jgi:AAA family ATPase
MEMLRQTVIAPLRGYEKFAAHGLFPPSGVLFYGPPGTGKTALARAAANDANAAFFVINGPDIVSEYLGESESCLKGIFAAARVLAPSVIFIDEIDALAPCRGGSSGQGSSQSPVSARLVTTLLTELDSVKGHAVVVLAATNRVNALDESLRRPGRLDKEIEVGVPSEKDRADILRKMLVGIKHSLHDDDVVSLAGEAHGFVGADISALCTEAAMAALRRAVGFGGIKSCTITVEDFNHAKSIVRPSALRELVLETPKVKWEDIGGNEDAKQQLKEIVEWPRMFQDSLSRIGASPPRGVLLYGPPGCSKTLLAKAVAREANMNFMAIKGPELFNKFVGESEKALRNVFEK